MKRKKEDLFKKSNKNKIEISKLDELIKKAIDNPDEFYIKIESFLSPEERVYIRERIYNKSCETCTNGCCRVPSYEKVGIDENGKAVGSSCIGWDNRKYIGMAKVLENYNIELLEHM